MVIYGDEGSPNDEEWPAQAVRRALVARLPRVSIPYSARFAGCAPSEAPQLWLTRPTDPLCALVTASSFVQCLYRIITRIFEGDDESGPAADARQQQQTRVLITNSQIGAERARQMATGLFSSRLARTPLSPPVLCL